MITPGDQTPGIKLEGMFFFDDYCLDNWVFSDITPSPENSSQSPVSRRQTVGQFGNFGVWLKMDAQPDNLEWVHAHVQKITIQFHE